MLSGDPGDIAAIDDRLQELFPDDPLLQRSRWFRPVPNAPRAFNDDIFRSWLEALPGGRYVLMPCSDHWVRRVAELDCGLRVRFPASVPAKESLHRLVDKGAFAAIYVPAFQAKDLALALDEHKGELTPERRKVAEPAIAKLVRAAYLLDAFGDIGNKQRISEAYAKFVEAATDITASFPQ